MLRTLDRKSRFYGFEVWEVLLPEEADCRAFINMRKQCIYINKSARAGANVVRLIF